VPKVEFRNNRGLRIVGNLVPAQSKSVVVMAHGFTGDRLHRGRFPRLASALEEIGIGSLLFDFCGCGESDDEKITLEGHTADLEAAIAFVQIQGFNQVASYGQSLGSLICLRAYSPAIATMVLAAAATGPMHYEWEQYFSSQEMQELREMDQVTISKEEGPRRSVVVDARMLRDFEEIDQQRLLMPIQCPVLIIHGDGDHEERRLVESSRNGMRYLPEGSVLAIVHGASHRFENHLDRLVELTCGWFSKRLSKPATTASTLQDAR
jgi:pimeloyl-ACP methyl ester carboxylesterase